MEMKNIFDNDGNEVTLHDIAYLIYQRFGQTGVIMFAHYYYYLHNMNVDISWHNCEPCDCLCPFYEDVCLVCATARKKIVF